MLSRISRLALLALCAACTGPGVGEVSAADYSQDKMMAKWMEFMTPGPEHKVLDTKVGSWDMQVTMHMPDGTTSTSTATSEVTWILDGRYLQETVHGSFDGMPFQGIGLTAFDNLKQCYVYSWVDNMGTGIMGGEGYYDPSRRMFTYRGESPDVVRGEYVPSRSTETLTDENHWKAEMWSPGPDGKDYKSMELVYTRRG